jgi:hypothetical protein
MRNTHTYVTLEISASAYDEIAAKLRAANYGHCFNSKGEIDMTGIAVVKNLDRVEKSQPEQAGILNEATAE